MPLPLLPAREEEFLLCRELVFGKDFLQHGIGSLAEKSQHAVLKNYYCPNPSCQEINLGRFVADISDENGITEIQTAGFGKMRAKLDFFLKNYPVRIVYPVPVQKWICWIDPETGEISSRRRSPKKNAELSLFRELYSILDLLWPDNLSITLALLESEEYRLLDGWGADGKRGSNRAEMVPLRLLGEIPLQKPQDLLLLLPEGLPPTFTSSDMKSVTRLNPRQTSYLILVLNRLGLIERCGKQGRFYLYRISDDSRDGSL